MQVLDLGNEATKNKRNRTTLKRITTHLIGDDKESRCFNDFRSNNFY